MLLRNDTNNKNNKYSLSFYYNFLYLGKYQDFLFFSNSHYSDVGSIGLIFHFLIFSSPVHTFGLFFIFNFEDIFSSLSLKFLTTFCMYMSLFTISQGFFLHLNIPFLTASSSNLMHEYILLSIMEINCFSIPCTAPVSSVFPVCVCVCV